jgi:hypothetical protein
MKRWDYSKLWIPSLIIVSIIATQMMHSLILVITATFLESSRNIQLPPFLYLLIAIVSVTAGGMFLGRVANTKSHILWLTAATLNAAIPVIFQIFYSMTSLTWLSDSVFWMNLSGNLVLYYIGAFAGFLTQDKYPSVDVDRKLFKYIGLAMLLLLSLNIVSWSAIHFNKDFRLAKKIDIPLPPETQEIQSTIPDPWIAVFRRFEATISAGDQSIYLFYKNNFTAPSFEDVTHIFSDQEPGVWTHFQEQVADQKLDYQSATARWRDLSGKVLISMILHAEKTEVEKEWDETPWKLTGVIYSRPYAEPAPSPVPESSPAAEPQVPETVTPGKE